MLWWVRHTWARKPRDRKTRVAEFVALARSSEEAIALVRDGEHWGLQGGTFEAEPHESQSGEVPPVVSVGVRVR